MYVLTSIAQLETTGDSCVDRLARNPDHGKDPKTKEPQTCLVGRRLGDDWRCGGGGLAARPDSDMGEGSEQREEVEGMEVEEVEVEREEGDAVMVRLPKNYQLTGPTVWREPKLMSPWAARPLFLANIKEGRETMIPFFRNYLDPEIHLVTHYSSNPAWEGGEFCLWSARGRAAVRLEECTVTNVEKKTVVKNPIRRQPGEGIEMTTESRKRPRSVYHSELALPKSEVARRLEAYKWMLQRGQLDGLQVRVCHIYEIFPDFYFYLLMLQPMTLPIAGGGGPQRVGGVRGGALLQPHHRKRRKLHCDYFESVQTCLDYGEIQQSDRKVVGHWYLSHKCRPPYRVRSRVGGRAAGDNGGS
jgi:hypothetical protein